MAPMNFISPLSGFHMLIWFLRMFPDLSFLGLQMAKLEGVIQTLEKKREEEEERAKEREKECAEVERQSTYGLECVRVKEELENMHRSMQQIQVLAPVCSTHTSIWHEDRVSVMSLSITAQLYHTFSQAHTDLQIPYGSTRFCWSQQICAAQRKERHQHSPSNQPTSFSPLNHGSILPSMNPSILVLLSFYVSHRRSLLHRRTCYRQRFLLYSKRETFYNSPIMV